MLRVTIELWPYGDKSKAKEIAHADIANTGEGDSSIGHYIAKFYNEHGTLDMMAPGKLRNYPKHKYPVWRILYLLLASSIALGGEPYVVTTEEDIARSIRQISESMSDFYEILEEE